MIDTKKLSYKTSELPNTADNFYNLPALTAGIENQGLNNYVPDKESTILKEVISISANGANTGATFYQKYPFTVLQDAYAIIYKGKKISDNQSLFIVSAISKSISDYFEWTNKATWARVSDKAISLPINQQGNIDFDFMESFIAELEAQHIAELEAYLKVTGLDNYELTEEEKIALNGIENVKWQEFKMNDLFEKIKTKKLPYKASELPNYPTGKYTLPALTSSFKNQGLNYYVPKEDANILNGVISLPSNSDVYRGYYQSRDFTILSDSYVIDWINNGNLNASHYLYAVASINKVTDLPIYSYKNKLGGWNKVKDKIIALPINSNNKIDFDYMETLITAIQKLVIKDVVEYKNRKIETTKSVVNHQ